MDKALKSKLQKLFDVVMEEAETNEEFSKKIENAIGVSHRRAIHVKAGSLPGQTLVVKTTKTTVGQEQKELKSVGHVNGVRVIDVGKVSESSEPIVIVDANGKEIIHATVAKSTSPQKRKKSVMISTTRGSNRRDKAVLDPIRLTEDGDPYLKEKLEKLSEKELKDIIADYGMDPSKLAMKWKDRNRLIQLIMDTSARRATKGDAFRNMD